MSDDHPSTFEGLARWLGDDTEPDPRPANVPAPDGARARRSRRVVRIVALLAPWMLTLAALAAASSRSGSAPPRATERHDSPVATAGTATPPAAVASGAPTQRPTAAPPADAQAIAVRLVRDAVTGQRGGVTTAVDVAAPEPPELLGGDHWLVRVHAVVLRGDTRRWRSAAHEVWVVPVGARDGRAVGLGQPWPVTTRQPRVARQRWVAEPVDEAAARAALRAAGLRPAGDLAAERHPRIADVIRVRVAGAAARHAWLRTAPTMRVLGADATEEAP